MITQTPQAGGGGTSPEAGTVVFKGNWDASGGSFPGSGSAQKGWQYRVSVAGTVNSIAFSVGDLIQALVDSASTSTYAANWAIIDNSEIANPSISNPRVIYVRTNGDDGTGEVGNPSLPFESAQAAFNAGIATSENFTLNLGACASAEDFGGIIVGADMSFICSLVGQGYGSSKLGGLSSIGAPGADGSESDGGAGGVSYAVSFVSDGSVDVGVVTIGGGAGGHANGSGDYNGGDGGDVNSVLLIGLRGTQLAIQSGPGGNGVGSGAGGAAGDHGPIRIFDCVFLGPDGSLVYPGTPGTGGFSGAEGGFTGSTRITRCVFGHVFSVTCSTGLVAASVADSFSINGGMSEVGNTAGVANPITF